MNILLEGQLEGYWEKSIARQTVEKISQGLVHISSPLLSDHMARPLHMDQSEGKNLDPDFDNIDFVCFGILFQPRVGLPAFVFASSLVDCIHFS